MIISKNLGRQFSRSVLFLVLLFFGLGAGCRAAPPLPPQPQPPSGTPVSDTINLTLWHSQVGAARTELEGLARDFHAAYPNLTVTPQYVGSADDLKKQVTAGIALGRIPDLILADRRDVAQFARQGGLVALDRFRADSSTGFTPDDVADLFPGILDEGSFVEFHNQVYAIPFDAKALVLYYNADALNAASYANPPATWDEFVNMASKLTNDQQYGWAMQIDADVFSGMLVSRGSAMLDDPERRSLFAERGGVAAMTLASELTKSGAARPKVDREAALADLAQGRAALYVDWLSALPEIENAQKRAGTNFAVGIGNLPQADPTGSFMLERSADLAIFKTSSDRESNAWFFIRWITASRQTASWARTVGAIPLRASALSFMTLGQSSDDRLAQIENRFGGIAPHFVPRSANRQVAAIDGLVEKAWAQIVLSKADVIPTLTAAAANADQLLGAK